jgi:tight adherence protein C
MECQGEVRILKIPVCVVPGNSGKKISEKQKIIADLKKLEEKFII